ncbi:diguanylate cyclase and metal dependent phosphohydrolase [Clostridium sp. CAG:524]|jgi:diguanylate cyclase (GGDEF)-like protein|nr:diguanylate cyclase and metal dependent phosphohydrolase [Clostridium sp. CAG:524]
MKNNKKKKKSIIIVFAIIIILVSGFLGTLYYITSTVNNYSYSEKKWISENTDTTYDVYVEPSLPIFSNNGKGVYYEYLNALKEDTGLNLNIVTTDTSNIKLVNKNYVGNDDIVIYKDHFIVVGEKDTVNKLTDLGGKTVGVLESDSETISLYLTAYKNINIKSFNSYNELSTEFDNKSISYMIVPMYKYINDIVTNDYEIVYHLDGLYSYYCLELNEEDNADLVSIMKKFYYRWENKAKSNINEYFLDIYYTAKNYTEIEKESITNEDFIVGYIENLPYEGKIRSNFTGLTNTYLSKFADMTGVTYKYIEYKDTKELNDALSNKKIDLALNYYSLSNDNYTSSRTLGPTEYVVLAHVDNNIVVNSLYSLVNMKVSMLSNMNLKYNMASKNLFEIKDFATVKTMIKNIDKDSIVIIEKEVYDYYKDSSLKNYSIRLIESVKLNNSFLLNKSNTAFNKLFDFYLSTLSSNEMKNESVVGVIETLKNNRLFNFIISNLLYIVIGALIVGFIIYTLVKKSLYVKKIKKEDRLYYFDAMTNLKNRNYLNDNIDFWSGTKVYPQAIVVIDINKLKLLNDRKGHEAGDNQIKAVANVLIKTQRDNSEIMRTDGDEFMIYLVGYDEKKIGSYIHKLNRELLSSLPHKDYGVSIGYSMITNEQTTIDDAINDSLLMIKKSKGNA